MRSFEPKTLGLSLMLILASGKVEALNPVNVVPYNHTHHNTLLSMTLEPVSYMSGLGEYEEARAYWLPDYTFAMSGRSNEQEGERFEQSCKSYGNYSSACPSPKINSGVNFFGELTCYLNCRCPDGYVAEADCALPKFVGGGQCDGKWEKCEKDIDRACRGEINNFVPESECPEGWRLANSPRCPYNEGEYVYGVCCNKCSGYEYTEAGGSNPPPQGYVIDLSSKCASCDGLRYKMKQNVCGSEYSLCSAYGAEPTAKKCYEGSTVKYDACKTCPHACTMSESECKSGGAYVCSQESCSGDWCRTGCATGYTDFCSDPQMDCTVLGYDKSVSSCSGMKTILRCPYNINKMACF